MHACKAKPHVNWPARVADFRAVAGGLFLKQDDRRGRGAALLPRVKGTSCAALRLRSSVWGSAARPSYLDSKIVLRTLKSCRTPQAVHPPLSIHKYRELTCAVRLRQASTLCASGNEKKARSRSGSRVLSVMTILDGHKVHASCNCSHTSGRPPPPSAS